MPEGTGTFEGLGLPRLGEYEQEQQTAATDMVTLTGAASMTGDFLVCQNSSGTELAVIDASGNVTGASLDVTGQVEAATLAVTGIGTLNYTARAAGVKTYSVSGLGSNDVVVISPREDTDGVIVVDKVSLNTLQVRAAASEGADVEFNYLVISKT
jgi:hypothetical protein